VTVQTAPLQLSQRLEPPCLKRFELGRMAGNNGYLLARRIDGIVFVVEMPDKLVALRGILDCCRHARVLIEEMVRQRRLRLLNEPSPSRWAH
jgi:hypothetical protein